MHKEVCNASDLTQGNITGIKRQESLPNHTKYTNLMSGVVCQKQRRSTRGAVAVIPPIRQRCREQDWRTNLPRNDRRLESHARAWSLFRLCCRECMRALLAAIRTTPTCSYISKVDMTAGYVTNLVLPLNQSSKVSYIKKGGRMELCANAYGREDEKEKRACKSWIDKGRKKKATSTHPSISSLTAAVSSNRVSEVLYLRGDKNQLLLRLNVIIIENKPYITPFK